MRRDEEFEVGDHAHLDAAISSGTLQVRVAQSGAVKVTIDCSNPDIFEIDQIGNTITIREESRWLARNRRVRVVVDVPPEAQLTVRTASADVEVLGRVGVVKVRSGSGDIDIDECARADVDTASGNVRMGAVAGDAAFTSASGDVAVRTAGGQLVASTASGDVSARTVANDVDVGTASGDVEIGRCDGDGIKVKTISGDIRLGFPTGIRVEPDIATMSGTVTLPAPAPSGPRGDRRAVRVRMSSTSGDIRVDRAE